MAELDNVSALNTLAARPVLLCLSHLRWGFVTQRPQHLLTRAAVDYGVVFLEEPVFRAEAPDDAAPVLALRAEVRGIVVATPVLPLRTAHDPDRAEAMQRELVDALCAALPAPVAVLWFYTAMAFAFAGHVRAGRVVYDCMDELSAFAGASPHLRDMEGRLLRRADLVFTGGRSLFEAKRTRHPRVRCFPSSVDVAHFAAARAARGATHAFPVDEPDDQARIAEPRIGFFGVVDERMDLDLLAWIAALRPDWQFVIVGPVVKIDPATLPRAANLHWLGEKPYAALPDYLAGWDAGIMPFARNEATRHISPTKTPEFLAAGLPVVSTPIPDVVRDWGRNGLVEIAATPLETVTKLRGMLARPRAAWLAKVDLALGTMSWDATWEAMAELLRDPLPAVPAAAGSVRHV